MNKETFLSRLEQLLYDIPREEREEAMDYYRSYFEEAGAENEAAVLEELDSPQEIAASIKEDLKGPGYEAGHLKNPPQVRSETADSGSQDGRRGSTAGTTDTAGADSRNNTTDEYGRKTADYRRYNEPHQSAQDTGPDFSGRYGQYGKQTDSRKAGKGMDKQTKLILLVILAVFAFPVWGSAASVVFGIIGVAIAAVVVLGIFSIGGVLGGVVCAVVGIVNLCMMSLVKGLLALGTGMLLIAGGGISFVFLLLVCGRFLPWAVRQIINLLHRLLDWGRSIA